MPSVRKALPVEQLAPVEEEGSPALPTSSLLPRQIELLDHLSDIRRNATFAEVCKASRTSVEEVHAWLSTDPAFCLAWQQLSRQILVARVPMVCSAIARKAEKGNIAAARLFAEFIRFTAVNGQVKAQIAAMVQQVAKVIREEVGEEASARVVKRLEKLE